MAAADLALPPVPARRTSQVSSPATCDKSPVSLDCVLVGTPVEPGPAEVDALLDLLAAIVRRVVGRSVRDGVSEETSDASSDLHARIQ